MSERQRKPWSAPRWRYVGVGTTALALVPAIVIAVASDQKDPPSTSTNVLLVVVAAALQFAAAWFFTNAAKVDTETALTIERDRVRALHQEVARLAPNEALVTSGKRRLFSLGVQIDEAVNAVQAAYDAGSTTERREALGHANVAMRFFGQAVADGLEDWNDLRKVGPEENQ